MPAPNPIKLGLDYSARRLSGASIKKAGYDFVFRYLDFPGQRYPALNKAEYEDLTRNGVEVHAIFEISIHDPGGGRAAGRANAVTAVNSARAAGLPKGSVIFMCADAPVSQWPYTMETAMEYLDGARVIIEDSGYIIGAYGFNFFIYAAQAGRHADVFWLCGAETGLMNGQDFRNIHAYQWNNGRVYVDGVECDLNKMFIPLTHTAPGGGGTAPTVESDDTLIFVGVYDHENNRWASDERFLLNGGLVTGGFTSADVLAARADTNNGPVALLGLKNEVFQDLRLKSEALLSSAKLDTILALVEGTNANVNELKREVDELELGGVSEERIGEIAVDAVKDDLSD